MSGIAGFLTILIVATFVATGLGIVRISFLPIRLTALMFLLIVTVAMWVSQIYRNLQPPAGRVYEDIVYPSHADMILPMAFAAAWVLVFFGLGCIGRWIMSYVRSRRS